MTDETPVMVEEGARFELPSVALMLVFAFQIGGAFLAAFVFGADLWLPVLMLLLATAAFLRRAPGAVAIMLVNVAVGFYASIYLYGFWIWPAALLGMVSVAVIATHFYSSSGAEGGGDQNPIIFISMIVGMRAFAALVYATVSPITSTSTNYLQWLSLFVLGTLPDLPTIFNVLLSIITTGTLVVYLALLIKRLVNPLAN